GQPHREQRHQALPPGQHLGSRVTGQGLNGLGERRRPGVTEGRWLHSGPSGSDGGSDGSGGPSRLHGRPLPSVAGNTGNCCSCAGAAPTTIDRTATLRTPCGTTAAPTYRRAFYITLVT